jgi:hypothetical protein
VSADLCDALAAMVTVPRVGLLELRFYWAPVPGLGPAPRVTRVGVRRRDATGLTRLRGELGTIPRRPATAVYGQITRLDRGSGDDDGVVTIHGVVGRSTPRTVRVAVRGGQYTDAIRAYQTRAPVVATGRLLRAGGAHILTGTLAVA